MTVKRRLFISNILMIVVPVILCVITGTVVMYAAMNILGLQNNRNFDSYPEFERAVAQVQRLAERWASDGGSDIIAEDVAAFGGQYSHRGITLLVFQNGEPLCASGDFTDKALLQTVLDRAGNHSFIMDDTLIYKRDAGTYELLLSASGYNMPFNMWRDDKSPQSVFYFGIIIFSLVVAAILVTNRILTRMVYSSIATPLDALVYGVHQLRDGNLEYRIDYTGRDEFAGICADFNEMAERLLDMVNARQKDDENRRELIAGISHDLRTPLTSIISYVEGLEKGVASTPEVQKRYLDTIKNKAMDLEHIVSQLFLFSKLDVGEFPFKMEKLDIGNEISGFAGGISDEYESKGLRVVLDTIQSDITVNADPVQLRNVFTNILDNSLKYGKSENSAIRVACRAEGQNVVITFTDNGPGVPPEALDSLFTAFYRGDKARSNPGQGSGLGLAVTAKILERLGGSVKAENAPDGGLRVIIKLPEIAGG